MPWRCWDGARPIRGPLPFGSGLAVVDSCGTIISLVHKHNMHNQTKNDGDVEDETEEPRKYSDDDLAVVDLTKTGSEETERGSESGIFYPLLWLV